MIYIYVYIYIYICTYIYIHVYVHIGSLGDPELCPFPQVGSVSGLAWPRVASDGQRYAAVAGLEALNASVLSSVFRLFDIYIYIFTYIYVHIYALF